MKPFSARDAWFLGIRFFSDQPGNHAIILIVLGILLPFGLQYLLIGQAVGLLNGTGAEALAGTTAGSAAIVAAMAGGYVLQAGSYFASWRLGLGRGESLGGAILFGLAAGLLVVVGFLLVGGVIAFVAVQFAPVLGGLVAILALFALFALVATTITALFTTALSVILLLSMLIGTVSGNVAFAANLVGGSGLLVVLLIVLSGLLLWQAGRLSCAMPVLAEQKSFNLLSAIAESRRLTLSEGWLILRYLGLLGLGMTLLSIPVLVAAGAGAAAAGFSGGEASGLGVGAQLIPLVLAIPLAYLTVLVPAGIYRELAGAPAPVEVFA